MNYSPDQEAFNDLSFYTLSHSDTVYFIHQHIVDAFQAQTATEDSKPISVIFSLIGLYLFLEHGYTGRQVQLAHMRLARNKVPWPKIKLPANKGSVTVHDVLSSQAGPIRDARIKDWCASVWKSFKDSQSIVQKFAKENLNIE